ncbi:flavodoxin [Bacillus phage W.Ph.]|uniref:Gp68 n=1 Tax=Bacillus phage W.Ph. TaxID=764595 RepID=G9B1G9_9CAUD|nr:flavodoxin [Bacillus phage W.Ph.]ADH03214.1 gp68 [Bacillus phage W.Ph.]
MKSALLFYSVKGNTVGIFSDIEENEFTCIVDLGNELTTKSMVKEVIEDSDLIVLAIPSYYPTYQKELNFPKFLQKYEKELLQIRNKRVIVVGSGRSEYKYFCGAVDYFKQHYVKANYVQTYKFEGYPRQKEIDEFTKLLRGHLKGGILRD